MHSSTTSRKSKKVRKITQVDWSDDDSILNEHKKRHLIYQIKFDANISEYEDKRECNNIMKILNECELILNVLFITRYILKEIAEFACGFIKPCTVCLRAGEISILPSALSATLEHSYCDAEQSHSCNMCNTDFYVHICNLCQDTTNINAWWLDTQRLASTKDIGKPMISCIACDLEDYRVMELCYGCYYICYGCGNRFDIVYHEAFECLECGQEFCPRCKAFSDEGHRLLRLLESDNFHDGDEDECIICYCNLSVMDKDFNYTYKYNHFKDRFSYFLIMQTLLEFFNNAQEIVFTEEIVSIIAHYSTGLHFIDDEGSHHKIRWNDEFEFPENIKTLSTCELSVLYADLIPYSCHSVQYDCMANVSPPSITTSGDDDLYTMYNLEHCTWYIHFCDICKVNCWGNKYDGYTHINSIYPSASEKHALQTICQICIKDIKTVKSSGCNGSKTVKLCKYCGFECKCCETINCKKHLSFICKGGCGGKFCTECVAGWYGFNIAFIENCINCNDKMCMWCRHERENDFCEACNGGLVKFVFES